MNNKNNLSGISSNNETILSAFNLVTQTWVFHQNLSIYKHTGAGDINDIHVDWRNDNCTVLQRKYM